MDESVGRTLRERRVAAGMSQRDLARVAAVPQPNIAAYESGRRMPSMQTRERLDQALAVPTLERVQRVRAEILDAAARRRLSGVRVFGSVARGQATIGSDVDLLVTPESTASIFDLAGFMAEVEELLGVGVDVVSDRGTGAVLERIRDEAVPL